MAEPSAPRAHGASNRARPRREGGRRGDEAAASPGLVWTRQETSRRQPLTREAIVAAAIALADAEGVEAVSLRRVATELNARTMSLYSFIARKEDLFDLMADEAVAEVLFTGPVPADWSEGLRTIARRTRETCLRHRWAAEVLWRRPRLGPNGVRHVEQSLAVVASLPVDDATRWRYLQAVDGYTIGQVLREWRDEAVARDQGMTRTQWRASVRDYLQAYVGSGDYPHLAASGAADALGDGDPAASFEAGLDLVIAGIAAELADRQRG